MNRIHSLPQPYSIKRDGVSITNCDDEPVQSPGCILDHGMMLTMHPADLLVSQVSDNCERWTGQSVADLLGRPLAAIIGDTAERHVAHILATESLQNNPTYALTLRLPGMNAGADALDLSLHLSDGVLIVELEPTGRDAAAEAPASDYYVMIKQTLTRLRVTRTLATFCDATALEMRRVTGLDRVLVYRFHADDSGEVVADAHRADLHSWFGLHYPAGDIPKPAREIFKHIGIRPVPNAAGALSEMAPLRSPASGRALDMTYCALRGASVMYTEYLANMGVAATLTMPILREGELWGLIVCHHYTPTAMPYQMRAAAEFLGQMVSIEMAEVEAREHLQYRHRLDSLHHALVARSSFEADLGVLVGPSPNLLDGIDAGGVAVLQRERWLVAGRTPSEAQLRLLAPWLQAQMLAADNRDPHFHTDRLGADYPAAAGLADFASGLLAVPLSRNLPGDLLLWFRAEQIQTFSWAGNPQDKPVVTGVHGARLTPRRSFDIWQEQVRGRSLPWSGVEIDSALRLRQWMIELVASRAEQLADLNAELSRNNEELDAFTYLAGHDLKEPLRGIHQNAQRMLEQAQAGEALDAVALSRIKAVMRSATRMETLLDSLLHFARVGRLELEFEYTELGPLVADALAMMGARLLERPVDIRLPRPLPVAWCEPIRLREVLTNLLSNALKYTDKTDPWIEVGYLDPEEAAAFCPAFESMPLEAAGQRLIYVRDNGIGIEARHRERIFMLFKRLHSQTAFGGGSGAGLAIARKLVEQHQGRLWFESVIGHGTTFYFNLPDPTDCSHRAAHNERQA